MGAEKTSRTILVAEEVRWIATKLQQQVSCTVQHSPVSLWPRTQAGTVVDIATHVLVACTGVATWSLASLFSIMSAMSGCACRTLKQSISTYFLRWRGGGQAHPGPSTIYRVSRNFIFTSLSKLRVLNQKFCVVKGILAGVGSFLSLLLIGGMQQWINYHYSLPMLLATFGPGAALIFGLPDLPASQPLNCFGKWMASSGSQHCLSRVHRHLTCGVS